jgi:uncharacterized membrane-anchored protein
MRRLFILAAVFLQMLVLVLMAGEREHILANGRLIHLRTAPIDPRDLLRGDYVRLNYEISRIGADRIEGAGKETPLKKGTPVYVVLKEGSNGLYDLGHARLQKPNDGIFLKGRTLYPHHTLQTGQPLWMAYGIEAYFVEQGAGVEIEKRRGDRAGMQVPLEMEIAVSHDGTAVIRGYRWSPLGIGLQMMRSPGNNQRASGTPDSAAVRLTLANASDKPLAIVNRPNACSFSLEPVPWAKRRWAPANNPCRSGPPTDSDVVVLSPGEEKSIDIDFAGDRWRVKADGEAVQIGALEWSEQFRLVYRPPEAEECRHLEQYDLIWHGYLASRAFHGRGQVD